MPKNLTNVPTDILEHIISVYPDEEMDVKTIQEILDETDEVYEGDHDRHRWYETTFRVVDIGGKLIGYESATTTGDNTPEDVGWVFDPSTICWAEPKVISKTIYVRK